MKWFRWAALPQDEPGEHLTKTSVPRFHSVCLAVAGLSSVLAVDVKGSLAYNFFLKGQLLTAAA